MYVVLHLDLLDDIGNDESGSISQSPARHFLDTTQLRPFEPYFHVLVVHMPQVVE